ncbi:hypothetical protein BDZ94DRAFT_1271520 [Collybia nuda]|uniref:Uncharacterized protein n=1 Tax=Collybia nuda TaxID=64659 RepID=A0A9P5XYS0_9AGAR|nr:hypothetical protein BDZ94DRAFT_1271520 [Collybia nuda]
MQIHHFSFTRNIVVVVVGITMCSLYARAIPIDAKSYLDGSSDTGLNVRCERGMKPPGQRLAL